MKQFNENWWEGIHRNAQRFARHKAALAAFYDAIKVEDAAAAAEDAAMTAARVATTTYRLAVSAGEVTSPSHRRLHEFAIDKAFFAHQLADKAKDAAAKRRAAAFAAYKAVAKEVGDLTYSRMK